MIANVGDLLVLLRLYWDTIWPLGFALEPGFNGMSVEIEQAIESQLGIPQFHKMYS